LARHWHSGNLQLAFGTQKANKNSYFISPLNSPNYIPNPSRIIFCINIHRESIIKLETIFTNKILMILDHFQQQVSAIVILLKNFFVFFCEFKKWRYKIWKNKEVLYHARISNIHWLK
jgi:hypothetical protein